ncbi:MAG TPA: excinuclease ABC subunit UvrC [Phycisphaerales bacterium]|nr:excinuclease ABC subunit UvrC [Phycisphaerales bacterium]
MADPKPNPERDDRLAALLKRAHELPPVPGVYLMKDAAGVVLYVGKAGRLPNRVSSYFVPSADLGPVKQPMLDLIIDFDTIECESEVEALLTEARLIKDIKPKFNALMTDGKAFPYLIITQREDFPRVFVTRNPAGIDDKTGQIKPEMKGAKILGPFTSPGSLREALQVLQKIFQFRTCHLNIIEGDPKNRHFRPCLLHAIGQCSAPCADKISKEAYRQDIARFVRFLGSKRSAMLRELRQQMNEASKNLDFELAATLRDQIKAIEKLDNRASTKDGWQPEIEIGYVDPHKGLASLQRTLGLDEPIRCVEGFDIAHLQGNETVGSKVCFVDGRPFKNEYRRYKVTSVQNDDYKALQEVVSRRYREAGNGCELYPEVILIDGGLGQLHAAMEVFDSLNVPPPMVVSLAKKEELIYVQRRSEPIKLGRDNFGLRLLQQVRDEAHRFAQHYHHILRRKKTLGE